MTRVTGGKDRLKRDRSMKYYAALLFYFLSVALVLLMLYQGFQGALLGTINTMNADFISQVENVSSSVENILQNLSAQIYNARSVAKLRTYSDLSNADMIDGMRELNSFTASSAVIDSIYVYNGKRNYIYSTASYGAVSDNAGSFKDQGAADLFLNRKASERLVPIARRTDASTSSANRFLYSIMMFDTTKDGVADNALMLNISSSWIDRLYFGGENDGMAYIVTLGGALVAKRDAVPDSLLELLTPRVLKAVSLGDLSGYFSYRGDDDARRLCFYSAMGDRGWLYVRSVSYEKYLSGLMGMENNTYTFFAVVLVLFIAAGLFIAWRVYFPFRKMTDTLSSTGRESAKELMQKLDSLIATSLDAEKLKDELGRVMKDEVLRTVLRGGMPRGDAMRQAAEYGLSLEFDGPVWLLGTGSVRSAMYAGEAREFFPRAEGVAMQGTHSILLLQGKGENMEPLIQRLMALHPNQVFVRCGKTEYEALPEAYKAMTDTYDMRFMFPAQRVLTAEKRQGDVSEAEKLVEQVLQALKNGNRAAVQAQYDALLQALTPGTAANAQASLAQLMRGAQRLLGDGAERDGEGWARTPEDSLKNMRDIRVFSEKIGALFTAVTENVQRERARKQGSTLDSLRAVLDSEYADPALTSQALADRFSMSAAYLCRIFRQAQGVSLPDYLNAVRMRAAAKLLTETEEKVRDIARKVGVENSQYFFVLFKQEMGETPGEYRKRSRGGA